MKTWIIGALIFVAAIVVSLSAFGAIILWDIIQVINRGL